MSSTEQESPWSVTIAKLADIPAIQLFQQQLFADAPPDSSLVMTFNASNGPIGETAIHQIVEREECILVWLNNDLVGYVLLDSCSQTVHLQQMEALAKHLMDEGEVDPDWRIAPRYTEGWLPSLPTRHRKELRRYTLNAMLQLVQNRYDAILHGCRVDADELQQHFDNGWQIVYENGPFYFLIWDLTRSQN